MTTLCHFILMYDYTRYIFRKDHLYITTKRVYIFKHNDKAAGLVFTSYFVTLNIDNTNLSLSKCKRVSQIETLNIFLIFYHGRYVVMIHDSYPDVRVFHSLLRGNFPSRWFQLLKWPLVSLLGVADQVEESLLQD